MHKVEVREGLVKRDVKLPDDWIIDIDVKPYLGHDISYGLKHDEKTKEGNGIWFSVYSARYPNTWYGWLEVSLDELAKHIKEKGILIEEVSE